MAVVEGGAGREGGEALREGAAALAAPPGPGRRVTHGASQKERGRASSAADPRPARRPSRISGFPYNIGRGSLCNGGRPGPAPGLGPRGDVIAPVPRSPVPGLAEQQAMRDCAGFVQPSAPGVVLTAVCLSATRARFPRAVGAGVRVHVFPPRQWGCPVR